MGKTPLSMTLETRDWFFSKIARLIKNNECGTFVNLAKRDQAYRVAQVRDNFGKNINLVVVDLSSEVLDDAKDVFNRFGKLKEMVLLIMDGDLLFNEKKNLAGAFESLHFGQNKLSIIYFFKNFNNLGADVKILSSSTYTQNVIIFPLFKNEDCQQFMRYLEHNFSVEVPEDLNDKILKACGGYYWLIKQAVRDYSERKNSDQVLNNEGMNFRLKTIYEEFLGHEKMFLKKIVRHEFDFNDDERKTADWFLKTRMLEKNGRKYFFTVPILEKYIKGIMTGEAKILVNKEGKLVVNGYLVDYFLTDREEIFILDLIKKRGEVMTREEAGQILWGEGDYSDWALDQMVRRMRLKLASLGAGDLIVTKKRQGFMLKGVT